MADLTEQQHAELAEIIAHALRAQEPWSWPRVTADALRPAVARMIADARHDAVLTYLKESQPPHALAQARAEAYARGRAEGLWDAADAFDTSVAAGKPFVVVDVVSWLRKRGDGEWMTEGADNRG